MWISFYLDDKKIDDFLKDNGYQEASLVWILKKEAGYKNGEEIRKKYGLLTSCLREKVCWRNDAEYKKILQILNDILHGIDSKLVPDYYRGKTLTHIYFSSSWDLRFGYPMNGFDKTLQYYQRENIIKRWLQEKF